MFLFNLNIWYKYLQLCFLIVIIFQYLNLIQNLFNTTHFFSIFSLLFFHRVKLIYIQHVLYSMLLKSHSKLLKNLTCLLLMFQNQKCILETLSLLICHRLISSIQARMHVVILLKNTQILEWVFCLQKFMSHNHLFCLSNLINKARKH